MTITICLPMYGKRGCGQGRTHCRLLDVDKSQCLAFTTKKNQPRQLTWEPGYWPRRCRECLEAEKETG
jgi:hypothetical protein